MKNLLRIFVVISLLVITAIGTGYAQDMVYQTHQELTLAAGEGLSETWVLLSGSDYVRSTHNGTNSIVETSGWSVNIQGGYWPCIAEHNGTIWCAVRQPSTSTVMVGSFTFPPTGIGTVVLIKISSSGSVLDAWQATGSMSLFNIAVKDNGEIAIVGSGSTVVEHLTSPNGGGVVLISNGNGWDSTKGFFIETPSGGTIRIMFAQYLSNGNLALSGFTEGGAISFGGIPLSSHGLEDGFRGEITSAGVGISAVQMAGGGRDYNTLQITAPDGTFMVTGTYSQAITFYNADGTVGGTLGQFPSGASHDHVYFAFYNASSVFQYAEVAYNDGMTTDMLNIDLVYGNNAFYAMIGNTNGGVVTTPTGSHDRVAPIILKFDNAGAIWSKQVANLGSAQPVQYGEEILIEGDIVTICGTEYVSCDIDFHSSVVGISNTSYWCEYFDGIAVDPISNFTGTPTTVVEGEDVTFTENSTQGSNPITSWEWTFEGGTPGTFSGQTPPAIVYSNPGDYDVTLVVSDGTLSDIEVKADYIHVDAYTLSINPTSETVSASTLSTSFDITSNGPWITSSDQSWATATASGNGNGTVIVTLAENFGTSDRIAIITVSVGTLSENFTLTQEGATPFASYDPATISIGAISDKAYSDFETNDVSATNVLSGDNGASVAPINMVTGTTNVEVIYPTNLDLAMKQYVVTATTLSGAVATFTMNQDGATPSMELTPSQVTVNANTSSTSTMLSTQGDMPWTVDDSDLPTGWSVAPMNGTGNETFTVTMTVNVGADPVIGSFTINGTGAGAGTFITFPITQLGQGASLFVVATSSDTVVSVGTQLQLFANAAGGTGSDYTYEWTGSEGFISSEQNPFVTPADVGMHLYACIAHNDGNTATDDVSVNVFPVPVIEVIPSTQNGEIGAPIDFEVLVILGDGDPRTIEEIIVEFGDGAQVSGFTNPFLCSHTYWTSNSFDLELTVILSDYSIVNVTFLGFISITVGIEEASASDINIYPNPTSGNLFISTQGRPEMVSIMDISGREVFHLENLKEMTQIDLNSLPSGMYFVRITLNGFLYVKKIDKQ